MRNSQAARAAFFRRSAICFIALAAWTSSAHAQETLELTLERVARLHNRSGLDPLPRDVRDRTISSPKSVLFSADGTKIYINSLESGKTQVYSWPRLAPVKTISHKFTTADAGLFNGESTVFDYPYYTRSRSGDPNVFMGKPVESALSPDGRWLWIPYYRRDFDSHGQSPGAVAIIDTETDDIVRVMPTGPVPKYVTVSPDGRFVAVTHWGDNTIGLIDTSGGDPASYRYVSHLVVEKRMSQDGLEGTNRDDTCGYCLRGTVITPDSRYLLVARMGGGGLAAFDLRSGSYMGTLRNIRATPRHVIITPDGRDVVVSSNVSGYVSKAPLEQVIEAFQNARGRQVNGPSWREAYVGRGARTLDVTHDGTLIFAAVNDTSEVVAVELASMQVVARIAVDPFAVGLDISPDDRAVIVTSQGRAGRGGGNSINIILVRRDGSPVPLDGRR